MDQEKLGEILEALGSALTHAGRATQTFRDASFRANDLETAAADAAKAQKALRALAKTMRAQTKRASREIGKFQHH